MRKKILWICLPLAVIVAGVGIYLAAENARKPMNVFPKWWKIVGEPDHGFTPGTTLTLTGIDFDQPTEKNYHSDILHIRAVIPGRDSVGHGTWNHVEYLYNGEWYGVWEAVNSERLGFYPPGEQVISVYVPAGLFKLPSQYRIYVDDLGYCEYDNLMPGS